MPKPKPKPDDPVACQFLALAAELMDAYMAPAGNARPPRLESIHFPATLDWLRTEDVIRLAIECQRPGLSRKAFLNRWSARERFVKDALVYALLYRDRPVEQVLNHSQLDQMSRSGSLSTEIINVADPYIERLLRDPRSFLMMHVGPLLEHQPDVRQGVISSLRGTQMWFAGYGRCSPTSGYAFAQGGVLSALGCRSRASSTASCSATASNRKTFSQPAGKAQACSLTR